MMFILMVEDGRLNISGVVKEYSNRLLWFICSRVFNIVDVEDIL